LRNSTVPGFAVFNARSAAVVKILQASKE